MRSSSQFLICRACGMRYRSDHVYEHDKTCQNRSKSKLDSSKKNDSKGNMYLKEISDSSLKESSKEKNLSNDNINNQVSSQTEQKQFTKRPSRQPTAVQQSKDKTEMIEMPYPTLSDVKYISSNNSAQSTSLRKTTTQLPGDNPKQAWNANAKEHLSAKPNEPQPTKKYRHYPVSCEFCNEKFQPSLLKKHVEEQHSEVYSEPSWQSKVGCDSAETDSEDRNKREKKRKANKGFRFRICYICGRQFGSKSLAIHEPKCLEKWRIQNDQLPQNKKMPKPVKPDALLGSVSREELPGAEAYSNQLPEFSAENEAAYQSHLRNLVPCEHCGRKFNPDRVMIHEKACIQKPKKKKRYATSNNKNK